MQKEILKELVEKGFSKRKIADELNTSQTNVRYWLKKYEIKTKNKKHNGIEKFCPRCESVKPLKDFYTRSGEKGRNGTVAGYCKVCSNSYHSNRVREVKIKMIEYKGGECERCKLKLKDAHYSVYDFHHTDPNEKDSKFGKIKFQKWEKIKEEIDKCQLLCANCHRMTHAELEGW